MSNKQNARRQGKKRTETGPRYESHNPGKGCNSTHVARSRKKWKRRGSRSERRNGVMSPKVFFKNTKKNAARTEDCCTSRPES